MLGRKGGDGLGGWFGAFCGFMAIVFGLFAVSLLQSPSYVRAYEGVPAKAMPAPNPVGLPVAKITGEAKIPVGKLSRFSSTGSSGKCVWAIVPKSEMENAYIAPSGSELVYAAPSARSFTIVLVAVAGDEAAMALQDVEVGVGPGPGPGPQPNPPGPTPSTPLADLAYKSAIAFVPEANRAAGAARLVASIEAVRSSIAAGAYTTVDAAKSAMKQANSQALAADASSWMDWSHALAAELARMDAARQLGTLPAVSKAWGDIAEGLRRVK